jgi:hypothetical protein
MMSPDPRMTLQVAAAQFVASEDWQENLRTAQAIKRPCFEQGGPVVAVEALLSEPVVERLDVTVVPRLSGGM